MTAATLRSEPRRATLGSLYPLFWRWHFYAGLFVLPFILILSVTGSIYLFKPQIERWEERSWLGLGTAGAVSPDRQLDAVLAANPGARFNHYRLPREAGDAAMVQLGLPAGTLREVYVSPQGRVLGSLNPDTRIAAVVARIHGSLLIGRWGDWLVELAASWTIVMILTGLYLWWPRPLRLAGTLWPRLYLRGRPLLKDLHRVTGFWIAGLLLVMLASGLPWAGVWGSAFAWTRAELGWVEGPQDWKIGVGGGHAGHDNGMAMPMAQPVVPGADLPLSAFVTKAEAERMAFPVLILPPHAPQAFGPPTGDVWTIKSAAQNRTLTRQVTYNPATGTEIGRSGFADQHLIDQVVNTGVAWHEGQLFGVANQIIGVLTAVALIGLSVVGVLMWLRRRPASGFGAPAAEQVKLGWAALVLVGLGVLLPLFGASVLVILIVDRFGRKLAYFK
ncbi:PepSY domain-containing protein [Sphingomonas sp. BK580]|uniref:PepSY-associated TM helix domain-containing protein n=1 Tax=Sphingomonas sp. BK580 TaxID=2586972 RepID=UPI00179719FF|nr:PepSY domain-containing protein [Sphingomonas sp. BK580]MBB3693527.1 putative iron-regulated membrane protein [Sphingomonas sp. BK580]